MLMAALCRLAVSVSFSKRDRLVEFLIRRLDGRPVLLPLIKTMIEEQDPLASIARTFDLVNATTRHAIVPSGRFVFLGASAYTALLI
jgi:hypothetical protein